MEVKFIKTGETDLAYLEKNSQAGQTIFFIHGNPGSKRIWSKQFDSTFLDNYRLVFFDLPGCDP